MNVAKLTELYNEYNEVYFDNQLPTVPLKINNRKTSLGLVMKYRGTNEIIALEISKLAIGNKETLTNVLLHEMIHVLELFETGTISDENAGHGDFFNSHMIRLNAMGFNIVVVSSDTTTKVTPMKVAMVRTSQGDLFGFRSAKAICTDTLKDEFSSRGIEIDSLVIGMSDILVCTGFAPITRNAKQKKFSAYHHAVLDVINLYNKKEVI